MKNILVYINSMEPAGGIERVVANLVNEWSKKHTVTILVKGNTTSFYELNSGVSIYSINSNMELNMGSKLSRIINLAKEIITVNSKIKKFLYNKNFDYIYTTTPFNSLELYFQNLKFSEKVIISEHGAKIAYNKVYKFIKHFLYPKAFKIVVPNKSDTEEYLNEGINAIYIPHLSTFEPQLDVNLANKTLLNIGRLTDDKQQMLLLEIWNKICFEKKNDGWNLKIVGKGENSSILNNYLLKNQMLEFTSIVEPIGNVQTYYEYSSVFLLSSKYEGFGMVLLEAMSYGLPCISFDCPSGPRDVIDQNHNGFLVSCYNLKEYEEKILLFINNQMLLEEMSYNALKSSKTWDNNSIMLMWGNLFEGERT